MTTTSTRVVLAARPIGPPTEEDFRIELAGVPVVGDGQLLLQTKYLSLDPYMRSRMSEDPDPDFDLRYIDTVKVDDVMVGETVSVVVESRSPHIAAGSYVRSLSGWQTESVVDAADVTVVDPVTAPVSTALGVLGMPGLTAYVGILKIGRPQRGETVVVAAAAGPVGSAVGQIASINGARTVGIAGGGDKCAYLVEELGFDAAIDRHAPHFSERLANATPDGVDVYFENVGGYVSAAVYPRLNLKARVVVCGLIADYNAFGPAQGPDRLPEFLAATLAKRLRVEGFVVLDVDEGVEREFHEAMSGWIREGQLQYREDVVAGLENAPAAFLGMLDGKNFGNLIVEV